MLDKSLADRYSRALYETAEGQKILSGVLDAVASVSGTIFSDTALGKFFCHPAITAAEKKKALEGLALTTEVPLLAGFLAILIDSKRMNYLPLIHERLTAMYNQSRNLLIAKAVTAVPMDDAELRNLKEKLVSASGKSVDLVNEVDPSLIGGVRLTLGDKVIDATVVHRLRELRVSMGGSAHGGSGHGGSGHGGSGHAGSGNAGSSGAPE